jgi:hypothetical protein
MSWRQCLLSVCAGLFVILGSSSANALVHKYIEDFTSKQYCDTLNTTAWWDTTAGEIKLHPFEMTIVGSYDTPLKACYMGLGGDYLYVGDMHEYAGALLVLNVSDPTSPTLAASVTMPSEVRHVRVEGDYAFLAVRHLGLYVVDISDPTNPTIVGNAPTGDIAQWIAIAGDRAYVAARTPGLLVFDISDPTSPTQIGSYNSPGYPDVVTLAGDYAYIGDADLGLKVIDISDPTNPTLAGTYPAAGYVRGLAISGDHLFVCDQSAGRLLVLDVSDPTNPTLAGSYDTPGSASDVVVTGDYAYVADGTGGELLLFDISDPANPTLLDSLVTPDKPYSLVVDGEHAYVGDCTSGLQVVKIAEAVLPSLYAGSQDTPGYARGVAIAGDYAYVADFESGLQVIDISIPTSTALAGCYDTPGIAHGIALAGDYAYVADGGLGLQVIDISNPASPALAGSCDTPYIALGIALAGNYAYVADAYSGLQVIDIRDPTSPAIAGSCGTPSQACGIALAGDYAYVAVAESGLQVIDITDPTSPILTASCDTPYNARAVALAGDYAYVADGEGGLQVIDIGDPVSPAIASSYDTPSCAHGVALAGDHAYVADHESGLQVIEVLQRRVVHLADAVRSLPVGGPGATIISAKLTSTQFGSIDWELSADGGASWESVIAGPDWHVFAIPSSPLLWRSTLNHIATQPTVNPTCTDLRIDWRCEFPVIDVAEDVPNDQGGQVLLNWSASGYDVYDLQTVTHYSVWRAINPVVKNPLKNEDLRFIQAADVGKDFRGPAYRLEKAVSRDCYWEWLANVDAYYFEGYGYSAPTYFDSTGSDPAVHYFQVIAHTADQWVFWTSPPDSGYSVDNLAPAVPQGFLVTYGGDHNYLAWDANKEEDLQYYRVYRGTSPDFEPAPENLIQATIATEWNDPEGGYGYHYKITATDFASNESDAASAGIITEAVPDAPPGRFVLHPAVPNPFNPVTIIRYDLPEPQQVVLYVYDISGRLVRVLCGGAYEETGRHESAWYGVDETGRPVASGTYFFRLTAGPYTETKRVVLVR